MSGEPRPLGEKPSEAAESIRTEISREMVRIYKEQFGRGPTKARTDFAGPDLVICTLEESLTPAEHKLAALGDHQRLRDTRTFFQHATADDFRSIIERLLSRKVRAFVSGMDTEQDVSSEVFYLVPRNGTGADLESR
jgi:uncharacterized protein YbcI